MVGIPRVGAAAAALDVVLVVVFVVERHLVRRQSPVAQIRVTVTILDLVRHLAVVHRDVLTRTTYDLVLPQTYNIQTANYTNT